MKTSYEEYRYDQIRNLKLKLFAPDDGNVERYVIALHGFAGDMESSVIRILAEHLTSDKTAVLTFNYAGHGNDEQDDLFSLEHCFLDFQNAVRYAKRRYPDAAWRGVFATSFGGYLVLNSLEQIPENVRIVLRAPAVNMDTVFMRIVNGQEGRFDGFLTNGSVILGYEHKLLVPYSFFQELCRHDVFHVETGRGMLLINGTADEIVFPADTAEFCQRNPRIMHHEIKNAGHRMQNPSEIAELMHYACPYLLKQQ